MSILRPLLGGLFLTLTVAETRAFSIPDPPIISTTFLSAITVGHSVATSFVASHGTTPYQWSISSGDLPAGISLNASTGGLSGTPTIVGTASFTLKVTDFHSVEATQPLTWTVNAAPSISTTSLLATTVGAAYSQTFVGTGGTGSPVWSISAGSLPAGLSLNSSSGAVTGTAVASGTASFTVAYTDSNQASATRGFSIAVNPAPSITTSMLPRGIITLAYSQALGWTGGTGPVTWSVSGGSLPSGLSLNSSTGVISGVPTATGTFSFTIQAADPLEIRGTQSLSIQVVDHLAITTNALAPVTVGQDVSASLAATSGTNPYTWSISSGSLPPGITLNSSTGALTGTAAVGGSFSFTLHLTDAQQLEASQSLTWVVTPSLPQVLSSNLPAAYLGVAFWFPLTASGGAGTRTWALSSGSLPAGLSLTSAGSIEGTPTTAGTANFVVQFSDSAGATATQSLTLEVKVRPHFRVSPESLNFSAGIGGPAPAPQQIEVSSTPAGSSFGVATDSSWLQLAFDRSRTPAVLSISAVIGDLTPGTYHGVISVTGDEIRIILITLQVSPASEPALSVAPGEITISTSRGAVRSSRLVSAHITGPVAAITAQSNAPWLTVSDAILANGGSDASFVLTADPSALGDGTHEGAVTLTMGSMTSTIPVHLSIAPVSFDLSHSGLTFDANVDGSGATQVLRIANHGAGSLAWVAATDASWIRLNPPTGIAEPLSPLDIQVDTAGLMAGAYAAQVSVTPQAGGEPRMLDVRLDLTPSDLKPQVAPLGLAFRPTSAVLPPQQIILGNPGGAATTYTAAVSPAEAASWLTIGPLSGSIAAGGGTLLTAQVQRGSLAPGVYNAALIIEFADQTVRVVLITLTVAADSCTPTRLVPLVTKLGDHFDIRAGWPAPIEMLIADDCGQPVPEGLGLLQFSDPDEKALTLLPAPNGYWTATWTPAKGHASITATATLATADRALTASTMTTGQVIAAPAPQ